MRVGRKTDVVAVVTVEDFTGKEAKERTLLHGQGAGGGKGRGRRATLCEERCAQREQRGG